MTTATLEVRSETVSNGFCNNESYEQEQAHSKDTKTEFGSQAQEVKKQKASVKSGPYRPPSLRKDATRKCVSQVGVTKQPDGYQGGKNQHVEPSDISNGTSEKCDVAPVVYGQTRDYIGGVTAERALRGRGHLNVRKMFGSLAQPEPAVATPVSSGYHPTYTNLPIQMTQMQMNAYNPSSAAIGHMNPPTQRATVLNTASSMSYGSYGAGVQYTPSIMSTCSPPSQAEKRISTNGHPYTKHEFDLYFGIYSDGQWEAAPRLGKSAEQTPTQTVEHTQIVYSQSYSQQDSPRSKAYRKAYMDAYSVQQLSAHFHNHLHSCYSCPQYTTQRPQ